MKQTRPRAHALSFGAFFCLLCLFAAGRPALPAEQPAEKRLEILASLFPQYDFARRLAGDRADVAMLLPPGIESHSYEPSPSDMKKIARADLFLYTGEAMEPWVGRLSRAAGNDNLINTAAGIEALPNEEGEEHGHEEEHDEHPADAHYHEFDPHVWLDPVHALTMIDTIARALIDRDPKNADFYRANAAELKSELSRLDAGFRETVAKAPRRALVFGDRFAFAYFFSRYGLEEVGPYKFCAPGAEPGLKAVIAAVDYVRAHGTRFIYREANSRGRMADVMAEETGAEILPVDSLHNPTAKQLAAGLNYVDGMRQNMEAFAKGLE